MDNFIITVCRCLIIKILSHLLIAPLLLAQLLLILILILETAVIYRNYHQSAYFNNIMQYEIYIGTDNPKNNYRTWFYFSVVGFNQGTTISFKIKNMQNQVCVRLMHVVKTAKLRSSTSLSRGRFNLMEKNSIEN